ncbi:Glutathione S-transferase C-terminal domain [Phytophthora infestans]|uniref:Glutathione S-transferase C-terminal domain n=1 Tax=Phytophthora infestans TaxID=4787 RepID=A0A833T257_PHYIN|nr:Glutathione S-transferase C-terminal domain [Phytophthora infestans]KAF4137932.1 Glutathione S-transferase C-terminal domain-containing protein [Phytophthora infestans]
MVSESLVGVKMLISEIAYRTPDEAAKTEKTKKQLRESVHKTFKVLDGFIQKKPFFLGDKMTYGDLQLYDLTKNGLGNFPGGSPSKYPKLTTLVSKVESDPNVAAYLAKHQQ